MADFVEKLILDDSGFINPLEKSIQKIKETQDEFEQLNKDVKKESGEMGKEVVETNKKITKAQDETVKKTQEQSKEFTKAASSFKIFGISVNDVKDKLTGYYTTLKGGLSTMTSFANLSMAQKRGVISLTTALGGGRGAFVALAKGVNIFKAALVSTGIGALVVALGSLIAFLTTTQRGIDFVNRVTASMGMIFTKVADYAGYFGEKIFEAFKNPQQAIKDFGKILLDNIVNRFEGILISVGAVGRAIGNLLKGDFEAAKKAAGDFGTGLIQVGTGLDETQQQAAKDGIKQFTDDLTNAVTETYRLEQALQNLEKAKILFIKTESEAQEALEKYRNISRNTANSYYDRMNAAKAAAAIETQLTNERLKLAEEEYRIIREQNALAENKNKDYEKEYQAAAKVNLIKVESYRIQTRLNEVLNSVIREQEAALTSASDKLIKMGKEWKLVTEQEEFEFVKAKQIKELENLKKTLQDIGNTLKVDVSAEIKVIDLGVSELARREFNSEVEMLTKEIKPLQIKVRPQVEAPEIDVNFKVDRSNFLDDIEDFEGLLDNVLEEIFNKIDGPKAKEFLQGAFALVSEFGNIAAEATNIAIANIDKQIDKLSERRQALESDLDYELQLQKEGLANSAESKQTEVDTLISEEERLIKEREKLQAKAQRQQLVFDTAQQSASLITSSINIVKGFSNIPIVGLPLGIAAVGALLGFFAKTKADAFKATRLHTGADRVSDHFGFADRYGDTDLPGRGDGYRVVSSRTGKDTGVIISGREMLLPEKYSLSNEQFFTNLRMGRYDGIDLDSAVRFSQNFKSTNSGSGTKVIERSVIQPQRPQKQRVLLQVGEKKYTVVTIEDNMKDGQIIEIDL